MEPNLTAFSGARLLARGDLRTVAQAAHGAGDSPLLVFDDATGGPVELDLRGSLDDALARLASTTGVAKPARGRPRLGVIAREVTLLPRHWDWLGAQPGGASAALRRLVDQARRDGGDLEATRKTRDVVYRVMTALAGDLPGYEEATRALFAGDPVRFDSLVADWPTDICAYLRGLNARSDAPSE